MSDRSGRAARQPVVALFGPTAVGKTDVALALADVLRERGENPVAVCADALQVYAGMEVLTGAPTPAQREHLEHRLLGFVPVSRTFSVGEFMPLAHAEVDAALEAGQRPLVVGGTGLYLRAAIADLDLRPPPPAALRARIEREMGERGAGALHGELLEQAPDVAAGIHPADRSRIVRAMELLALEVRAPGPSPDSQLWGTETRHPTVLVGLVSERAALYRRIDARVDAMVEAGAETEARRAAAAGASATARKALGFGELLVGDIEGMKRRSRNLAKRQLTWMRKLAGIRVIDVSGRPPQDVALEVARLANG